MIKFNREYKDKTYVNESTIQYTFENNNTVVVMYDNKDKLFFIKDSLQDEEVTIAYMTGYFITTRSNSENSNIRKSFTKEEEVREYLLKVFQYEDISLTR